MTRIILLGCAGAGKTTLARRLGERTGAPVVVLDAVWQRGWGEAEVQAFRDLMREAHAGEAWISDGNFAAATFDIRLPRADQVVWLERPRWLCALRAAMRVLRPGEPHRLANLREVLRFIWGFERRNRPLIESLRLKHGPEVPVVRLRSERDVRRFETALGSARIARSG